MIGMIEVCFSRPLLQCSNIGSGIRKATEWYNSHISVNRPPIRGRPSPKLPTVVLMTEDAANRQKAEQANIASISVRKYVEGVKDANQLLDLLAAAGAEDIELTKAVAGRQALYPDVSISCHIPLDCGSQWYSTYLRQC